VTDLGLDAEKLRLLNEWAEGLQRDERAEVAAAGRVILMLVDEVERVHRMLWDTRLNPDGHVTDSTYSAEPATAVATEAEEAAPELHQSLRDRLRARLPGTSLHS
jgi:hypothetical protein